MRLLLLFPVLLLWQCQPNPYRDGEALYKSQCANCHMDNGAGLSGLIPTLVQSDYLQTYRASLPCALRYGLHDTIVVNGKTYAEQMPAHPTLSDIDITNVLNFVNHSWGNEQLPYTLEEVRAALEHCPPAGK